MKVNPFLPIHECHHQPAALDSRETEWSAVCHADCNSTSNSATFRVDVDGMGHGSRGGDGDGDGDGSVWGDGDGDGDEAWGLPDWV